MEKCVGSERNQGVLRDRFSLPVNTLCQNSCLGMTLTATRLLSVVAVVAGLVPARVATAPVEVVVVVVVTCCAATADEMPLLPPLPLLLPPLLLMLVLFRSVG